MKVTTMTPSTYAGPVGPTRERPVITTVKVEEGPGHDVVHVWNRGGKAGALTVDKGDGLEIARMLLAGRATKIEVSE